MQQYRNKETGQIVRAFFAERTSLHAYVSVRTSGYERNTQTTMLRVQLAGKEYTILQDQWAVYDSDGLRTVLDFAQAYEEYEEVEMKTYKCHKEVQAKPMNRGDYNDYKGWIIPIDEDPTDEGYLVLYEGGHESWSPKAVFEAGYSVIKN